MSQPRADQELLVEYEQIFNALNVGVFLYRTNKKTMQFLKANQFGCELFRFENEAEFVAYDWTLPEVCHPDEVEHLMAEMDGMRQEGDRAEHEYRLNRHNGTYVWVLCYQRVLHAEGEWRTILNSCTVIDEKKWAEEANAAKSAFLSNMSHDMRTPLNAIINMAALARDDVGHSDRLLHDLSEIEQAGAYLLSLVNDVLDMSKIENRELSFVPGIYRWHEFEDYVNSIFVPLCRENQVNFVWNRGTTALDLWVDRTRFNQLFFNLLSNAAKYTEPGGTVTFFLVNNLVQDGRLSCDYVVADTGIGMSEEFQKRMFEPFEREERASAYTGTGLGLAIVKDIVDTMQGSIHIESERGRGTTVTVHLSFPIVTQEQLAREKQRSQGPALPAGIPPGDESRRLLIVEDHPVNREILLRLLKKKGYTADQAVNGKEAVDRLAACPPWYYRAVLMDIRMPVLDGLAATRRIRQLDSDYARRVPIVAMTANAYAADVQNSLAAGMDAHLSKPVEPKRLFETLHRLIEQD